MMNTLINSVAWTYGNLTVKNGNQFQFIAYDASSGCTKSAVEFVVG